MKIQFDTHAKIAGIGLVPWTRLGPERWFNDFRIASLYDWDLHEAPGVPQVHALSTGAFGMPQLAKLNSQHLVETPEFQKMVAAELSGYDFLTYKPVRPPLALQKGHRFLGLKSGALAKKLENKAYFRQQFGDIVRFPDFRIVKRQDITPDTQGLKAVLQGRGQAIVQDEQLGGGRGTYKVRTVADLAYALQSLEQLGGSEHLVISDLIEGVERSVQACATRYGTFVGPLQKQIIAHPLLANLAVPDGDKFCGAEIAANDPHAGVYAEIKDYAQAIGERITGMGYRGIFSVDCLVDAEGRVFVLEINPRITGITPLLTMLYRGEQDIPFYLLHILELTGQDYKITDTSVDTQNIQEGSLLILHSTSTGAVHITQSPSSGLYAVPTQEFVTKGYRLNLADPTPQLLVQQYTPPGFTVKPGGRLVTALLNQQVLGADDDLLPQTRVIVQGLLAKIELQERHYD